MAVYNILKYGDPALKEKALEVKKVNSNIEKLLDNLIDTMDDAPGVGLAAPQIGVPKRVIVVKSEEDENTIELINPVVVSFSEEREKAIEACLSVPGVQGEVERHASVTVEGLNRNGEIVFIEAEGFLARALQHEIDHLDGILFVDRAERLMENKE